MAIGTDGKKGPQGRRNLVGSVWKKETARVRNIGTLSGRVGSHTTTTTTTTTTTITTKSTENLLGPYAVSDSSLACECLEGQPGSSGVVNAAMEILHDKSGYYSSLGAGGSGTSSGGTGGSGSTGKKQMANLTEIARL